MSPLRERVADIATIGIEALKAIAARKAEDPVAYAQTVLKRMEEIAS